MKINNYAIILLLILGLFLAGCNEINDASDMRNSGLIDNNANQLQNNERLPPDEAIDACKGKDINDDCSFQSKDGTLTGVCNDKPGVLACAPSKDDNKKTIDQTTDIKENNEQIAETDFDSCIYHTKDNPECKDCCDCLTGVDGDTRTSCRDTCATHDFSDNSDFITITVPSNFGVDGDYSQCVAKGSSSGCKACCEDFSVFECGDFRHCRTACNNAFGDSKEEISDNFYDPDKSSYNIDQAISDRAQENTIAYDALAYFTGNTCADSFIPPGKVADFFGYQYLRDATQEGQGHSTDFVTNSANNVLYILNDEQKQMLIDTAEEQVELINQYAYDRYPLLVAFRRQLEGNIPSGKTELSKDAVIEYSEDLYLLDAQISMQRAELFGQVIRSLDDEQIAFLDDMVEGGFYSWEPKEDQIDKKSLSHDEHVLVMTFASEMFGWYAGDIEADTYFCPERHGTYFGSFYMKDAPAMGNEGYVIDETLTGDKGETLLNMLEISQSQKISSLVDVQKDNLNGIVETRRAIATELRNYLIKDSIDEEKVLDLARQYGAYDGENVYYYAMHFAEVFETLSDDQKQDLMELRNLDGYPCEDTKIYLYSEKIDKPSIPDTDFLFE